MDFFECKIKYEKTLQDGKISKVSEAYLVDALSFTEAEKRLIEEVEPYMTGEYQVSDIKRTRYTEFFSDERESADRFYAARVAFITLDEKSGKEKRTISLALVQAHDLPAALARLQEGMKGTMGDYEIVNLTETKIIDVFRFK